MSNSTSVVTPYFATPEYLLITALVGIIPITFILLGPSLYTAFVLRFGVRRFMRKLSLLTGRHVLVMSHRQGGFLFGNMITMEDVMHIESLLRKFRIQDSKGVDFIINTFGGDLFASMRLALLVKGHPDMRIMVPKFAWSGGSLTAMAGKEIFMDSNATLSPVDPQLGSFWKFHSSKDWQEIIRQKGKKADDDSIAMSKMSDEIMKEMRTFLAKIVDFNAIDKDKFFDAFLTGERTHGDQFDLDALKALGLPVREAKMPLAHIIVEKAPARRTVFGI